MTELKCTVQNCAYNENMLCSRQDIKVEGAHAKSPNETSCGSFAPKGYGATNLVGGKHVCSETKVRCEVKDCAYHRNDQCHADSICVDGHQAASSGDTKCSTFKNKSCC